MGLMCQLAPFQELDLLSLPLAIIFQITIVFYSYVEHSIKNQYYLYTDISNDKAVRILHKKSFYKRKGLVGEKPTQ